MRLLLAILFSFACLVACDSDDEPANDYAPCDGESGACHQATLMNDPSSGSHCLCKYYCKVDGDCPTPDTGTAVPSCKPFGDVVENGHTASCTLPCDANVTCPDGMECVGGECWGVIE